jgi:hypothetical protein
VASAARQPRDGGAQGPGGQPSSEAPDDAESRQPTDVAPEAGDCLSDDLADDTARQRREHARDCVCGSHAGGASLWHDLGRQRLRQSSCGCGWGWLRGDTGWGSGVGPEGAEEEIDDGGGGERCCGER